MASKSKRARMTPVQDFSRRFLYWAIAVFIIKLGIIFRIEGVNAGSGDRVYFVDGAWLGADGENYLMGYNALLKDGIFSPESILNYWPAGYPLLILFLSERKQALSDFIHQSKYKFWRHFFQCYT